MKNIVESKKTQFQPNQNEVLHGKIVQNNRSQYWLTNCLIPTMATTGHTLFETVWNNPTECGDLFACRDIDVRPLFGSHPDTKKWTT
jgi:hypothetical protein